MADPIYDQGQNYQEPYDDQSPYEDTKDYNASLANEDFSKKESGKQVEKKDSYSPDQLREAEEKSNTNNRSKDVYSAGDNEFLALAGGKDNFFKDTDKPKRFRLSRIARGDFRRNSRVAIGVGGGVVGLVIIGASLFSFLNVFKLDHILQNIDAKTFARYNAQFTNRSSEYIKSYIKVRMMQFGDHSTPDANGNLFFRANKVGNGSGFIDWYKTLKTSKFEQDLLQKDGIAFTSVLTADGKLRAGKITIKDDSVGFDPQKELSPGLYSRLTSGDPAQLASAINASELSDSIDKFVQKDIFDSDKAARRAIKQEVNDNVFFLNVIKRRRLRKNIQNMIGVSDWTFFETTTAKFRDKKTNIQQKILSKLLPDNNAFANLLNCIFTGHSCNVNNDIADATATSENLAGSNPDSTTQQETNPDGSIKKDKNGNPVVKDVSIGGSQLATDTEQAIQQVATEDLTKDATNAESTTISQRLVNLILNKFIGSEVADSATAEINPAAWWRWAKRIKSINDMMQNHTLTKVVKKARLAQLIAVATMYTIARDQMKTGQTNADEVNQLMGTLNNYDNSEGWQTQIDNNTSGSASAATVTNQSTSKQQYCSSGHVKQPTEYAWYCDDQKPNNGGTASSLENAWNNSVGYLAAPIAKTVGGIQSIPIVGSLINSVVNFTDSLISSISKVTLDPLLKSLGITSSLGKLMTYIMGKALTFLGAGPMFTGSEPGAANFLIAGNAAIAENSTRAAGGVVSTPSTLAYGNQLAANYTKEQSNTESLFDRYASINNPNSLASKSLFSVANLNTTSIVNSVSNLFANAFSSFGNIFSGRLFAAAPASSASSTAQWSGVDTYDIPVACQTLSPFDPNYVVDAVGVQQDSPWANQANAVITSLRGSITDSNVRDEQVFWKLVYSKIGNGDNAEDIAGAIYNCALLDQQVEGGLGYLYGYSNDGGL